MKVKDAMMGTPYYCQLDTNLGWLLNSCGWGTAVSFLSWTWTERL